MGHLFRIIAKGQAPVSPTVDWSNMSATPYNLGYVNKIQDTTTTQKEITSIPSPFARIELVKEAFNKVISGSVNGMTVQQINSLLHGSSVYHKTVSDTLDVAQLFYSYPSKKNVIDILVWNPQSGIQDLMNSTDTSHQVVGRTLDMFLQQDSQGSDPYNFGKMNNVYLLRYKGPGYKPMHIIGATSPATLFFSTANDESAISPYLCFGTDYAFDGNYASLDQRTPDFIKYLFALRASNPKFVAWYPELANYMDAVFMVLGNDLKNEIASIQNAAIQQAQQGGQSYVDSVYSPITFNYQNNAYQVEVNGFPLHYQSVKVKGNSDFEIKPSKDEVQHPPLVLPIINGNIYANLTYVGVKFGQNIKVKPYVVEDLNSRCLPGINLSYPYLTISDFLDDKIIQLPSEINDSDYFDGNFSSNSGRKNSYLLPILPAYFDYFTIDDLMGKSPSGKNTIDIKTVAGDGVEVVLRIPIQRGYEIEYKRIYNVDVKADKDNNNGAVVVASDNFAVGVFPPVKYANRQDAHYRVALFNDFSLNRESSCKFHCEQKGFFTPDYVVRNVDVQGDIRSKTYILEQEVFDCIRISVLTDLPHAERRGCGLLIPKFKARAGSGSWAFAIDFGTSNTHIEYTQGANQLPQPFSYGSDQVQVSMVCRPTHKVMEHVNGEFVPELIGAGGMCHFPMRTVLCIDKNNSGVNETGNGGYVALGNASPAFMYNKVDVGIGYNDYVPNLKWSDVNSENEDRIRCYIESLLLLIRTKVLQEGGSLSQTQIKWFYPISMSNNKLALFGQIWDDAYHKLFNTAGVPVRITESVAPYAYFQETERNVTNIVTIDIGGGTTDIVVADNGGIKLVTSVRFAADAIFGDTLVSINNGRLNGIIRQFKDDFINGLANLDELCSMLEEKTRGDRGNSQEVASFLFSLADNDAVKQGRLQDKLDFNKILQRDNSQKVVFYIFFTAIMYHLANLMKVKELDMPTNIAFSGNGSKVISVLSPDKEALERLTLKMFERIYKKNSGSIKLIINNKNPKEATCKGGLLIKDTPANISDKKAVLLGTNKSDLVSYQRYREISGMREDIREEIMSFVDMIAQDLKDDINLKKEFGIDDASVRIAVGCFNDDSNLKAYIDKGVKLKLDSKEVNQDDVIEESLFFYPIIGVMNDISDKICEKNRM